MGHAWVLNWKKIYDSDKYLGYIRKTHDAVIQELQYCGWDVTLSYSTVNLISLRHYLSKQSGLVNEMEINNIFKKKGVKQDPV